MTQNCEHDWQLSDKDTKLRVFTLVAVTSEEPQYYPPQGFVAVEVCNKCHLMRIPFKELESKEA